MKLSTYGKHEWQLLNVPMVLFAALWLGGEAPSLVWLIAFVVYIPIFLFTLWFFRDPDRQMPDGAGLFIAPADGVVADITPLGVESRLGCEGTQIGVFMSVFSVHVNRAPCDAVVTNIEHKPGSFLDVRKPEAYEMNESTTIWLDYEYNGQTYPVVMRQISGLVARHIVTDLDIGQRISRGERIGMIKFGSRVELCLPKELLEAIPVEIGQPAIAGETVLAQHAVGDTA